MMRSIAILPLLLATVALAKDTPRVTIQVVDSKASVREWDQYIPGTSGTSNTKCDSNTSGGNTAGVTGSANCTTNSNPGSPARTVTHRFQQQHVRAIMPNGEHVTLWCEAGFRKCVSLSPGEYQAEVKGNTAWIVARELDGKERKIKYQSVGGW